MNATLDVGCGTQKRSAECVGIDRSPLSAADVVWDLDLFPWPFEDNRFSCIHASHVIEHLQDVGRAMAEIHRVAQDGADVFIATPHYSSHNSFTAPTHRHHLAAGSFHYFTGKDFATFSSYAHSFELVKIELTFGGNFVLDNAGRFLAGRSLAWYERHAAWMFPALDIRCHLRARK